MDNFKKAERDLSRLYPDIKTRISKVLVDMKQHYKEMFVTEGFRSFERQNYLYAHGRTLEDTKIITNAKPGESFHNYGLAIDLAFKDIEPWSAQHPWDDFGRIAKSHGFLWGGNFTSFKDRPHIQLGYGMSIDEIQELYKQGGLEKLWSRIDAIRGIPIGQRWYPLS